MFDAVAQRWYSVDLKLRVCGIALLLVLLACVLGTLGHAANDNIAVSGAALVDTLRRAALDARSGDTEGVRLAGAAVLRAASRLVPATHFSRAAQEADVNVDVDIAIAAR